MISNLVKAVTFFIAIAVVPGAVIAQTEYSTTTLTVDSSNGDISGYADIEWSGCQDPEDFDGSESVSVNGAVVGSQFVGGPGYETFDSASAGYTFGPGSYSVYATYGGFGNETCSVFGSNASSTVIVGGPQASAVLISGPASGIREGIPVQITVTVTGANGYETGPSPTGTVVVLNGSSVLASKAIAPATSTTGAIAGAATFKFPTAGIAPGSYQITAAYNGDSNLSSSSSTPATITITQPKVASTTALAISPTAVVQGNSITLAATVTPNVSGITPTGMVTFLADSTSIGTAKLNSSGVAMLTESATGIAPGVYPVKARYGGDAYDYASVSSTGNVTVQAVTATTLTANPTTVKEGSPVTFTATVKRTKSAGTPTGTIVFQFADYTFATVKVNGSGVATTQFSTTNLQSGTYPITAIYNGDTLDATSTSPAVTITVQ
jgi:hypothetical protein